MLETHYAQNFGIEPKKTLLIIDEIQEAPQALTSLKYFCQDAPEYHVAAQDLIVWAELGRDGVPSQLAKENKKFVYGALRPGARARDFEESIQWLCDYGVTRRISRSSALRIPLSSYRDEGAFRLFCVDVGLLGALSHLPLEAVVEKSRLFTEFKGAITEQYVCQQLIVQGFNPAVSLCQIMFLHSTDFVTVQISPLCRFRHRSDFFTLQISSPSRFPLLHLCLQHILQSR